MKNILFFPLHKTSWNELLQLAIFLKNQAKITFLIESQSLLQFIPQLEKNNIGYILSSSLRKRNSTSVATKKSLRHILKNFYLIRKLTKAAETSLRSNTFFMQIETIKMTSILRNQLHDAAFILEKGNFDSVVVTGDRHAESLELPLLMECQKKSIPIYIPPVSYISDAERLLVTRRIPLFDATRVPFIKRKYSNQIMYDPKTKKDILFYTPGTMQALGNMGLLPDNPWIFGGGMSTKVLVDGLDSKNRLTARGCPETKIVITGHGSHDELHSLFLKREQIKKELRKKYGLKGNKITLLALPQLAEHNILDWPAHWKEIKFLCETIVETHTNAIINLHPKMDFDCYQFIETDYRIPITKEPLVKILPAADIYMATYSSTVLWAILCQIPTIVFDFYDLNYNSYDHFCGVKIIRHRKMLKTFLNNLHSSETLFNSMAAQQAKTAPQIALFDGKSRTRIARAILGET